MDIRERSFTGSARESDLPIIPFVSQRQHNFERGKWQYFYHVSKEEKGRRLRNAENSGKDPGTSEETIPEGQAGAKASGGR